MGRTPEEHTTHARVEIAKIARKFEPLDFRCDYCLAGVGDPCRTRPKLKQIPGSEPDAPENRRKWFAHYAERTGNDSGYMWTGQTETAPHKVRCDHVPPLDFDGDPVELRSRMEALIDRTRFHEGLILLMLLSTLGLD